MSGFRPTAGASELLKIVDEEGEVEIRKLKERVRERNLFFGLGIKLKDVLTQYEKENKIEVDWQRGKVKSRKK